METLPEVFPAEFTESSSTVVEGGGLGDRSKLPNPLIMFSKGGEVSSTVNSRASSKHFGKFLMESGTSFAILISLKNWKSRELIIHD